MDSSGFKYCVPDLREPIAFHLLVDGIYEPETLGFILSHLSAGGSYVDVGANIGAFVVPAASKVGTKGRVLAIEASPRVFPFLQHNLAANHVDYVVCHDVAAYSAEGLIEFYPAPVDRFGMGSIGKQFGDKPISLRAATLDRLLAEAKIENVDVLKIDVEGAELAVLQGAQRLLEHDKPPLVLFEFCDWAEARMSGCRAGDAQRFLMERGFSLWRIADFSQGNAPLKAPLTSGADMLVAKR